MALPIALQLYTVRDFLNEDFQGTLEKIAGYGYKYVELAGLGSHTADEVKTMLDDLGMTAIASHDILPLLIEDFDGVVAKAKTFGYRHVVVPWLGEEYRTAAGYREVAGLMTGFAARLAEHNLTLSYHNHDFEFETLDTGERGYDIFAAGTGYGFELDVYWVQKAGEDPIAWMDKFKGRCSILHMKDMADTPDRGFAEVGTGTVPLAEIAGVAPDYGIEYLVVEQDSNWTETAMRSAEVGFENLSAMV